MSDAGRPRIDAERVLTDLGRLAELTSDGAGAQRLCWGPQWRRARELLEEELAAVGVDEVERDEAGNVWARLPGRDREAPALGLGSHLDSVPNGGWLDGALGVMAALGYLRAWAEAEATPPRDLVLIDFADEEGARFGRSLFGSSALAGTLDPEELLAATDDDGREARQVLAENGVDLLTAPEASRRIGSLGTWLELHIEQGPVLERVGSSCAAVSGCVGVERHRLRFLGQAAHAGTTPIDLRRDAGLAAAETMLAIERLATEAGGVATVGQVRFEPGIVTAVPGAAELLVDLRHPERERLAEMLVATMDAGARYASARGCELSSESIWSIDPVHFDRSLVAAAENACAAEGGSGEAIPSGALHDAAEIARRLPTAMIFVRSRGGLSHTAEEDSSGDDLLAAIRAYAQLAESALSLSPFAPARVPRP